MTPTPVRTEGDCWRRRLRFGRRRSDFAAIAIAMCAGRQRGTSLLVTPMHSAYAAMEVRFIRYAARLRHGPFFGRGRALSSPIMSITSLSTGGALAEPASNARALENLTPWLLAGVEGALPRHMVARAPLPPRIWSQGSSWLTRERQRDSRLTSNVQSTRSRQRRSRQKSSSRSSLA
jgi:hypothetical protein